MINSIDSLGHNAWRYRCIHIPYHIFSSADDIKHQVQNDLILNNITQEDFVSKNIVLDFTSEGHDDKIIKNLIEYLATITSIKKIRVLFNTKIDVSALSYQAISQPTWMVDHCNFLSTIDILDNVTLTNKFLCLNGRPSDSRARVLSTILGRVGASTTASFGSGSDIHTTQQYQQYFPSHKLPLLIDGLVIGQDAHRYQHSIFNHYLINIISETSSQHDLKSWREIFVTEKTYKCFAWLQMPIWFAVPGLVNEVRAQGFDVFDDIIDHSYDTIRNEHKRINCIITTVCDFDQKYTLEDCQKLRSQLMPRLLANRRHLEHLSSNKMSNYMLALNKLAVD